MSHRTHPPTPPALTDEPDVAELTRTWALLGRAEPVPTVAPEDTDAAWEELAARLALDPPEGSGATVHPIGARRGRARTVLLRAAAVAALLLGGAAAWYQLPVTRSAGPGERLALTLPDGSEVTLNAGSTLRWRRGFSLLPGVAAAGRTVGLEGEAFFDVVSGRRPFEVEARGAAVRVLGTRFNVRARSVEVRVAVEEGRVEVSGGGTGAGLVLERGEAGRVAADGLSRESMAPPRIGAWRSGGLTAVDEPLAQILDELSLRYATPVRLADGVPGSSRLSVYYPELGSLESVLADLATQQSLQYRRTADGWEVF